MGYNLALTALAEPRHFWFHGFRAYVVPVIREIAGDRRDLCMIDCGCGTGHNITTLLQPHGRAFAFDGAPDALQRARSSGRPLAQADMEQIPFLTNTFDLATSFDVVHSVTDDHAAVREMARVLKPGGHLVMNVTALEFLRGDHSDVWGEQRRYTRERGIALAEGAGLDVVRAAYLFASLVPMMLTVRMAQRVLRLVREPSGDTELSVPAAPLNALLTGLVRAEAAVARQLPMPFGSSLLVVARKPTA